MPPEGSKLATPPFRSPLLTAPATRREMFLFGLLILAIIWAFVSFGPRVVVFVPDTHVKAGVIT